MISNYFTSSTVATVTLFPVPLRSRATPPAGAYPTQTGQQLTITVRKLAVNWVNRLTSSSTWPTGSTAGQPAQHCYPVLPSHARPPRTLAVEREAQSLARRGRRRGKRVVPLLHAIRTQVPARLRPLQLRPLFRSASARCSARYASLESDLLGNTLTGDVRQNTFALALTSSICSSSSTSIPMCSRAMSYAR